MFEELMLEKVWKATERFIQSGQIYRDISTKFKTYAQYLRNKYRISVKSKKVSLEAIFLLMLTSGASAETGSLTVHFAGCTEFAGWGPVSLAEAQPLVPA